MRHAIFLTLNRLMFKNFHSLFSIKKTDNRKWFFLFMYLGLLFFPLLLCGKAIFPETKKAQKITFFCNVSEFFYFYFYESKQSNNFFSFLSLFFHFHLILTRTRAEKGGSHLIKKFHYHQNQITHTIIQQS